MSADLTRFIMSIADQKKIHLSSFAKQRIASIERGIRAHGAKSTVSDIMSELNREDSLRLNLDRNDWGKIESQLKKWM